MLTVDPLQELHTDVQSFDISHKAYLYFNQSGDRCWTKGYFNGHPKGEKSVEVTRDMAIKLIHGEITQDSWLSRYFPKQMAAYRQAIEGAKKQFIDY